MDSMMHGFDTVFLYKGHNGDWQSNPSIFHNRGFLFGDGIFETMVFSSGEIQDKVFHEERLYKGLNLLGIDANYLNHLGALEAFLAERFGKDVTLRVRWNAYRAGAGKYTPESTDCMESLQVESFVSAPAVKNKAAVLRHILVPKLPWSSCKTLSALVYVQANLWRKEKGYDEVILLDQDGFVSEAGAANLFWVKEGKFYTPSLECACVEGVGRKKMILELRSKGINVLEGKFLPEELQGAERVFTTNVTGVSDILEIEGI